MIGLGEESVVGNKAIDCGTKKNVRDKARSRIYELENSTGDDYISYRNSSIFTCEICAVEEQAVACYEY